jgi:hypothetical protein
MDDQGTMSLDAGVLICSSGIYALDRTHPPVKHKDSESMFYRVKGFITPVNDQDTCFWTASDGSGPDGQMSSLSLTSNLQINHPLNISPISSALTILHGPEGSRFYGMSVKNDESKNIFLRVLRIHSQSISDPTDSFSWDVGKGFWGDTECAQFVSSPQGPIGIAHVNRNSKEKGLMFLDVMKREILGFVSIDTNKYGFIEHEGKVFGYVWEGKDVWRINVLGFGNARPEIVKTWNTARKIEKIIPMIVPDKGIRLCVLTSQSLELWNENCVKRKAIASIFDDVFASADGTTLYVTVYGTVVLLGTTSLNTIVGYDLPGFISSRSHGMIFPDLSPRVDKVQDFITSFNTRQSAIDQIQDVQQRLEASYNNVVSFITTLREHLANPTLAAMLKMKDVTQSLEALYVPFVGTIFETIMSDLIEGIFDTLTPASPGFAYYHEWAGDFCRDEFSLRGSMLKPGQEPTLHFALALSHYALARSPSSLAKHTELKQTMKHQRDIYWAGV